MNKFIGSPVTHSRQEQACSNSILLIWRIQSLSMFDRRTDQIHLYTFLPTSREWIITPRRFFRVRALITTIWNNIINYGIVVTPLECIRSAEVANNGHYRYISSNNGVRAKHSHVVGRIKSPTNNGKHFPCSAGVMKGGINMIIQLSCGGKWKWRKMG